MTAAMRPARLLTRYRENRRVMCALTARSEMPRAFAISRVRRPRATRSTTRDWRGVSGAIGFRCGPRRAVIARVVANGAVVKARPLARRVGVYRNPNGWHAICGAAREREVYEMATSILAFNQAMRKLWSDHVIWTRLYIMAAVADKPDPIAKLPEGVR